MKAYKKLAGFLALTFIVATPLFAIANMQALEDWWKLRSYSPPSEIQRLVEADTMTEKARNLFYVNHPELITSKDQFRKTCTYSEQTIVLGCYHPVNNGIAIYDVPDERLNGIEEVTAAHEMLHAAYDRLDKKERNRVNSLLQDYYANNLASERIRKTIDSYKKHEPNDIVNEMHSIFATEIEALPGPLEEYYSQYFSDRQKVVGFSMQYEAIFTQNQEQLNVLQRQIESLKLQLEADSRNIESEQEYLQSESKRMQNLLNSNRTEEYNAAVGPYNSRLNRYRGLVNAHNAKVERINDLIEEYNKLAVVQENLFKSIDTRLQLQPAQQ